MLSGSWFSPEEQKMLDGMKSGLASNKTVSDIYWCLDQQWGEKLVEDHPELATDIEWQEETFLTDINGIENADVVVAMTVPDHGDTGMAQEVGFAYGIHKPVILVVPDELLKADSKDAINLMVAKCATAVIPLSELADYDLEHIRRKPYTGKVY